MDALPIIPKYQRTRQEPKEILSVDEVKSMYEACKNLKETALLSCAYGLGLRRSEIVSLQLSDIDVKLGKVIVRSGKGGKRREVPMSDKVIIGYQRLRSLRTKHEREESLQSLYSAKRESTLWLLYE